VQIAFIGIWIFIYYYCQPVFGSHTYPQVGTLRDIVGSIGFGDGSGIPFGSGSGKGTRVFRQAPMPDEQRTLFHGRVLLHT
jgi:hypothetical protein